MRNLPSVCRFVPIFTFANLVVMLTCLVSTTSAAFGQTPELAPSSMILRSSADANEALTNPAPGAPLRLESKANAIDLGGLSLDFAHSTSARNISPQANEGIGARRLDIRNEQSHSSLLMMSLYATTALTQILDVHSTLKAIHSGGVELNPALAGLTSHPVAFTATKAGAAAGLIYAGHRLSKRNKIQAAIMLIAINSAYAVVAAHNYQIARKPQ